MTRKEARRVQMERARAAVRTSGAGSGRALEILFDVLASAEHEAAPLQPRYFSDEADRTEWAAMWDADPFAPGGKLAVDQPVEDVEPF